MRIERGNVELFAESKEELELLKELKRRIDEQYDPETNLKDPRTRWRGDAGLLISRPISIPMDEDTIIDVPMTQYAEKNFFDKDELRDLSDRDHPNDNK
jgi:hypothetical protein